MPPEAITRPPALLPARLPETGAPRPAAQRDSQTRMPPVFLNDADFHTLVRLAPLISIDFIIRNPRWEILLGLRNNAPAKGSYFVPGGIILKNERLADAFKRILKRETNFDATKADFQHSEFGWSTERDLLASDRVHENTKAYFR
jgi:colanic acid biosynthesis protein WcaH